MTFMEHVHQQHHDIFDTPTIREIQRRYKRKIALLAIATVLTFAALAISLILMVAAQANAESEVPDLKVCSLKVVDCGEWELPTHSGKELYGTASYYDYVTDEGWSSVGHRVAATRDFKRYSMVRVCNVENDKCVEVKVTDYGPEECPKAEPDCYLDGRVIDLSSYAFGLIADPKHGLAEVVVQQL